MEQQAAAGTNESQSAVDWDKAQMTSGAKSAEAPKRRRVIRLSRDVFAAHCHQPWADVEAAAFAGAQGVEPWLIYGSDLAPVDTAYVREGRTERMLRGRALLYSQGWSDAQ